MGDGNWWLNRVGQFAPTSNPGSNVPNYGLTMDVATAPWDNPADFNALTQSQVTSKVLGAANSIFGAVTRPAEFNPGDPTLWDRITGAGATLGEGVKGAVGAVDAVANKFGGDATLGDQYDKLSKRADEKGLKGWDRLKFIGGQDLASAGKNVSQDPIASKVFWALDKASEYGATGFVSATEAQQNGGMFWDPANLRRAHAFVQKNDLNAGEGFVQMFYDDEILDDEKRFAELRKHNTVFNFGALAFNATMAWKYAPEVLGAKAAGGVRNLRRGMLDKTGSANSAIQRTILSQSSRDQAEAIARNAGGIANRVRAQRALTLWDKSQDLRTAARDMGYEDFRRLAPFQNSASGVALSKVMQDVAGDDDAWNLVFRASIGDTAALPELLAKRADIGDKIDALELGRMPSLERDFDAARTRYEKRLAEQGRDPEAGIELTRAGDWFLEQDFQTAKAALDETKARLSNYQEHESWLLRTTRGIDDGRQTGTIFNTLDQLTPAKAGRELWGDRFDNSLFRLGGKVSTWRHDEFSPLTRLAVAPRKPMLKRVGVVNLTDVDEGAQGIGSYLDQVAYMAGRQDQGMRDAILGRWAGSTSDVERRQIVDQLEGQGIALVLKKHGITNGDMIDKVRATLQGKRADAWSRMSDQARYTTVLDESGRRLDKRLFEFQDEDGSVTKMAMPMDPTELPNWRPLTNLTDLDSALAAHKDVFQELSKAHDLGVKARRLTQEVYTHVGETLNTLWKPAALISLRWPMRVAADESFRVMLMLGVLPHIGAWGEGAFNTLHNTGFVKPYEWAKGRRIKTASLSEDSLRALPEPWDPFDPRSVKNPTAAVPFDAGEFGKADAVRQDRLLAQAAEQRDWLRRGQMGAKPRWAQRFEDRVAALNDGDSRGFFFDPVNGRARNKGFAVSVYPGRLRTFDKKPSAAELHWWMEKNADVLSIPSNQVAVWADKGTGRWHMDVVRATKRREDAMQLAARAEAGEFYDITDGFTRYMRDEDPQDHAAFAADLNAPRQAEQVDLATDTPDPSRKRKIGVGTRTWRTADGQKVQHEDVYGSSADDLNIYYSVHSAKGMAERLYGGYTKGLGVARARRSGNGARPFHPGEPGSAEAKDWAAAQSQYVNKHFRNSPIWLRMLDGQTDTQVERWMTGTPEGRALRRRMPERGMNPRKWVSDMRAIFDHTLPTAQARLAAKERNVAPDEWDTLIPHELRNDVHGDSILMAAGQHEVQRYVRRFVDSTMDFLGSKPADALVRHPFARNLYNLRMRNYLASLDASEITPEVMNAAAASARAFATKQMRRLLYNIADENQLMHMFRFVAPFFQAEMEVLERYAHLFAQKPEALVRTMQAFYLTQNGNPDKGLWYMVNEDGDPTSKFSFDNKMVIQKTPFVESLMNKMPGLKNSGEVAIPVSSIANVILDETPFLPSLGPLVTVPAAEFYYKDRPFKSEGAVFKWMFPFGTPTGDNIATRTFNGMAPAWGKRMWTALNNDFNDSAYANFANIRYQDLVFAWEKEHGKTLPTRLQNKLIKQAENETQAYWFLRAASSFVMPFPVESRSPQQFWIDQARKYRNKYGLDADRKFYDDFGADYFKFFTESTRSTNGLAPTTAGARGYAKNKKLIDMAPDLAGILAGPGSGSGDFNYEVYRWQLRTRKGPGSKDMMRELQDPAERIKSGQINQGWIEYGKLATAVDAEMRARGLTSLNSNAASDLRVFKAQTVAKIIERNPAWQTAYRSREDHLSNWLNQANAVAFDSRLDGRTDIEGMRNYLVSRDKVQALLQYRLSQGGSASLSANSNADLAGAWNSYLTELTSKNLLFAEIYHRYLEGDDLTTVVTN